MRSLLASDTKPSSKDTLVPTRSARTISLLLVAALAIVVGIIVVVKLADSGSPSRGNAEVSGSRYLGNLGEIGEGSKLRDNVTSARSSSAAKQPASSDRQAIGQCVSTLRSSMAPERRKQLTLDVSALGSRQNLPVVLLGYTSASGPNKGLQVFILRRSDCGILGAQAF